MYRFCDPYEFSIVMEKISYCTSKSYEKQSKQTLQTLQGFVFEMESFHLQDLSWNLLPTSKSMALQGRK